MEGDPWSGCRRWSRTRGSLVRVPWAVGPVGSVLWAASSRSHVVMCPRHPSTQGLALLGDCRKDLRSSQQVPVAPSSPHEAPGPPGREGRPGDWEPGARPLPCSGAGSVSREPQPEAREPPGPARTLSPSPETAWAQSAECTVRRPPPQVRLTVVITTRGSSVLLVWVTFEICSLHLTRTQPALSATWVPALSGLALSHVCTLSGAPNLSRKIVTRHCCQPPASCPTQTQLCLPSGGPKLRRARRPRAHNPRPCGGSPTGASPGDRRPPPGA